MSLLFSYPSIEANSLKLPSIETIPLQSCPNISSVKNLKKSKVGAKYKKVVLPPLLSCREVELVNNLSMESTEENNPLSSSLLQAKEKERIETSIINKRKGIKTENSELRIIRKKEMKRIFKEFIENNYENRYHASVETVIGFSRGTK